MKQIIVNVSGLSVEEKQRVNEALAKITGFNKMTYNIAMANWMYAPSSCIDNKITYSRRNESYGNKEPTHTPQQVLEMAGMAGMTEKRKVRADFYLTKEYSVDVSECTEEEKKEVQQAFFDVGVHWARLSMAVGYPHLDALQYTNTNDDGITFQRLFWANNTQGCNMTPTEFLELVYEPEQQGHIHAHLMALYAEDAKTTDKPWELWEFLNPDGNWVVNPRNPMWTSNVEYRRKPKTHTVHGVEVPDLRFVPCDHQYFYKPEPYARALVALTTLTRKSRSGEDMIKHNLCYEYTDAGKQAAILHAKAWLGIA